MKTQTVWKVLFRRNRQLFSYAGSSRPTDSMSLRYFTNRVNKPRKEQNPFLFCFDTVETARKCRGNAVSFVIYEAEATGLATLGVGRDGHVCRTEHCLPGTVFADSLKLIKRIK